MVSDVVIGSLEGEQEIEDLASCKSSFFSYLSELSNGGLNPDVREPRVLRHVLHRHPPAPREVHNCGNGSLER